MPVLYEVFRVLGVPEDVRMQLCVGTSLAIIVPTTIRSYLAHRATARCRRHRAAVVAAGAGRRCASARCIAAFAPPAVFKIAFVVIAI